MAKHLTLLDGQGVYFEEYHLWLPSRIAHWPTPPRVTKDSGQQALFKFNFNRCWWCGADGSGWTSDNPVKIDLHHLCAGTKGRSHERELFAAACRDCHDRHVGTKDFGRWLFLKWKHDHRWCNWTKLAIRHGRFLPDPVCDKEGSE